jgi:predicted DNA-binding protein (MmcQ/YjbR family)
VQTPDQLIDRLRKICLSLPEAVEKETWGHPTFRVRDKIFVGCGVGDGITTMSAKTVDGEQEALLEQGEPFFFPKYVGSKGWIGVVLSNGTDWDHIWEIVVDSYQAIAPKKLGLLVDDEIDARVERTSRPSRPKG